MNLSWVTPLLAVGGHIDDDDLPRLVEELSIRHVVDVRLERSDCPVKLGKLGVELLCLPTEDHFAISEEMLERGVQWVSERLDRNERVYIHCQHGIGRSVMLTWCVLVARGEEVKSALCRIKRARACASPSPAQVEAFMRWCEDKIGKQPPTFDELAFLAYHSTPRDWNGVDTTLAAQLGSSA